MYIIYLYIIILYRDTDIQLTHDKVDNMVGKVYVVPVVLGF